VLTVATRRDDVIAAQRRRSASRRALRAKKAAMANEASALTLVTSRLVLTVPGPEAARSMVRYFEDNREHLTPWEPPFPDGMFRAPFWQRRLAQNQEEYRAGKSLRLVLMRREAPQSGVVGMANFTQFVRGAFMACTLGYSLHREAQGQGLMHEALERALRHVFDDLGMHRVMANYLPINERSGRLLRRLGFQIEGYARDYIFINGAWRDHILTSRLSDRPRDPDYITIGS
jgi:ribosomal-protein-alanine N-acetyltransferase